MNTTQVLVKTDDGAELAVWSSGPDDADAIMLIHGFSLDHSTWEPVATLLVAKGYRVLMPDLRGHGSSTLGTSAPTPARLVADVDAIATAFDVGKAHIVGHSLGAVVALAARTTSGLSVSITTVTSVAGTEQSIQNPVMRAGAHLFSSPLGIWTLGRRRLGRLMISTWFGRKASPDQLDSVRRLSASCARETRTAIGKATSTLDLRPSFTQPGPPTLVVCGRKDQATPFTFSARIAEAIDGAILAPIEGAGHMVIIEKPGKVADVVSGWIETLATGA